MSALDRERNTILAALRFYQEEFEDVPDDIKEIALDGGEDPIMSCVEIDELCERLNCGGIYLANKALIWRDKDKAWDVEIAGKTVAVEPNFEIARQILIDAGDCDQFIVVRDPS